jgi:hypothetical protein
MRAGAFAAKSGFSLSLLFLVSGNLQAQEETTPAQGDRGPAAIEQGTPPNTGNLQHFDDLWRQRWRASTGKVSATATPNMTPLPNTRRPFIAAGSCPGGCGEAASCCDCSKSLGAQPGQPCCIPCSGGFTACCVIGGGAGCIPAGTCCSDADCKGGQQCSRPGGTCSCPTGQTLCGGTCTNTKVDPNNCGGCDNQCPDIPRESKCCAGGCVQCPNGGGGTSYPLASTFLALQ